MGHGANGPRGEARRAQRALARRPNRGVGQETQEKKGANRQPAAVQPRTARAGRTGGGLGSLPWEELSVGTIAPPESPVGVDGQPSPGDGGGPKAPKCPFVVFFILPL